MSKQKLIVFDIDGTLYRSDEYEMELHREIVKLLAEKLGCSTEEARAKLRTLRKEVASISWCLIKLGINLKEFYEELAKRVNPSEYVEEAKDVKVLLRKLKEAGFKLAVHTNSGRALALKVLGALGIDPSTFDIMVTSDDAEPKPSRDGYLKILKIAGVTAEEVVYVGDRYDIDLKTAKELGIKTVIIGKRSTLGNADFQVENVLEIENLFLKV
ncbi:MAG: HAD family hydrolase [Nitrososphaerota archaeon]|nr:HAD family hydrolase [Aigarchaeota archaeon]MDW8076788.1 HAD family hydrolase [Nitrososphaerota archaeon]